MRVIAIPFGYKCRSYSRLSVTTGAVVALEAAKVLHPTYGPCAGVLVTIEDNDIRRTIDGTTPTTGVDGIGATIVTGDSSALMGGQIVKNLKMIGLSGTGIVHVDYFYEK